MPKIGISKPFTFFSFVIAGLGIILAGIQVSRASVSLNPPENVPPLPTPYFDRTSYFLMLARDRDQCSEESCRWWFDYTEAKLNSGGDSKRACELFTALSEKQSFPLRPLALLHRAESCGYDSGLSLKTMEKIKDALKAEKLRPWVEDILNEGGLQAALQAGTVGSGHPPEIFEFALKASALTRIKKEKIEILQRTLEVTKDAGDAASLENRPRLMTELFRIAPHLKPEEMVDKESAQKGDDQISAGVDFLSLHDFESAATSFEAALHSLRLPIPVRRLAFENLKTSYKALQRKKDAFDIGKRLYFWEVSLLYKKSTPIDQPKHVLASGIAYAKALWTEHRSRDALDFLAKLEKTLAKTGQNISDLYFVRARIDEELRRTKVAMTWMTKAVKTADPAVKGVYGWTAAWIDYKEEHYEEVVKLLEDLQATETDQGRRSQEIFWLAKSLEKLKRKNDGKPWLERIIQEDPLSYYALLAYRELGRPIPKNPPSDFELLSKVPRGGNVPKTLLPPVFQWMIATGEMKWAQRLLDDDFPLPDPGTEINRELLQAYSQARYFVPVFSRISKMSPVEKEKLLSEHSEFLFPRLFRQAVDEASVRSGVWPSYIFAIMRQESSFDPTSISGANAYGLLQLLPSVAADLAAKTGVPYHKPEDLLDPTTNILLGAQHLRNYWDRFDGQFILATAAYNASPDSVRTWVHARFRGDPLMFIEDIPYEETRIYVKLVLRNFVHYLVSTSEGPSLAFPEWCLEGIHTSKE